jgi:hypothetical protein
MIKVSIRGQIVMPLDVLASSLSVFASSFVYQLAGYNDT